MAILKNVLGLDLGSHCVKAVEFRQTLRSFEAVQLQLVPRDDDEIPVPDLIERFLHLHRFATDNVVSAIPGDRTSTRRLAFPFGERRRLSQAVPFELADDLPFEIEDFVIAWDVVGGDRSHTDVVAALAPREEVSRALEVLRAAGCEPRTLEAEGLVLGNLSTVFDLPGTRLLVDFGHRKLCCCLMHEGRAVAARSIPIGGRNLTEAMAKDRGLSREEAERAKCEDGVFRSGLTGTPEVEGVLRRVTRELLRTLGSFEPLIAAAGAAGVEEITLLGGSAQLQRIDEYLGQQIGVATRRLGLPREAEGVGIVAGGSPLVFAPAIALGLRGTARARTRMNFRRDEFALRFDLGRYRRDFGSTLVLAMAALILAVVGYATSSFVHSRRAASIDAAITRIYSEAFPNQPVPENPLTALRQAVRVANERADFLGVYRGNLSALDLLAEISRRVPADLDIALEELSIDRQTVRMRVRAKSFEAADRLGAELSSFGPFQGTRIGAIETDRKTGTKRFNVTIGLGAGDERETE